MIFPEPVHNFLDWLQAESDKPGASLERQEEITQTMCDLFNRHLLFPDDETPETPFTEKERKFIASRISAQSLLKHREIASALSESINMAHSIGCVSIDDVEEFAHAMVWFIKEYVTVRMLPGLWKEIMGMDAEEPDWPNLVLSVFDSVKPQKPKPRRSQLHPPEMLREGALPMGTRPQGYRVMVDDNSEFSRFNVRWCLGEYATFEDAEKAAQGLVENSLLIAGVDEANASEIFEGYSSFGDDPFIEAFGGAPEPKRKFSAWHYAGSVVRKVCAK